MKSEIPYFRIQRDQAAGLVIDIQEKLFPFISGNEDLAVKSGILIRGLQVLKIPIVDYRAIHQRSWGPRYSLCWNYLIRAAIWRSSHSVAVTIPPSWTG